ncbi:YcaO-like family protein [Enterococcus faecalis]|nr:hypothetical protein [Enterococcus faecalis]EGO6657190.1 hypothetical protein [Enterococcus faecalis]EGO7759563.1 hypothetical protein [Enterococcus faecalis]EGO8073394.1 hypothetical protein [Enterococcus faecalis]EGO8491357.1 hypothetical protein [Enterococcus faecalis]
MIERRILLKGFLRNKVNFVLNEDLFMSHHYNVYIEKYSKRPIKAYEVDLKNKRQHILSTLGEYLERETLINENSPKEHTVIATNLIDGSIKQVNLDMVLFKNSFVDSSGMASHKKSKPLIWTAYKEFFERQSYITNFLFHTKAQQLNIDKIEEIKKIDRYLTNYLDNVKYYNISLSKNLYVVLAVGYGEKYKAVGLGTSQSARKAVIKSQKEILQYFATSHSKYKEEKVSEGSGLVIDNKDIYHDYFDRLSSKEVKDLYAYLEGSEFIILNNEEKIEKVSHTFTIKNISNSLNMSPYITMLENNHAKNVKVVKVFDPKWFPNMAPRNFSKEIILNVENILKLKRKNFSELLPFP